MDILRNDDTMLFSEIKMLIEQSREHVAAMFNEEIALLYWHIGRRINSEILDGSRAEYGKRIIKNLSAQLTAEYGKGWSHQQLRHCLRIAETFPDIEWLYTAEGFSIAGRSEYELERIRCALLNMLDHGDNSIIETANIIEDEFLLPAGAGLQLFKQLVLEKKLAIDLSLPMNLNAKVVAA